MISYRYWDQLFLWRDQPFLEINELFTGWIHESSNPPKSEILILKSKKHYNTFSLFFVKNKKVVLCAMSGSWCETESRLPPPCLWENSLLTLIRPGRTGRAMGVHLHPPQILPISYISIFLKWREKRDFENGKAHFQIFITKTKVIIEKSRGEVSLM